MRISDWSSDVCSSDLSGRGSGARHLAPQRLSGRGGRGISAAPFPLSFGLLRVADADPCARPVGRRRRPVRAGIAQRPYRLAPARRRSEEHTSELQSLMRISYAVFRLKKNTNELHIEEEN